MGNGSSQSSSENDGIFWLTLLRIAESSDARDRVARRQCKK